MVLKFRSSLRSVDNLQLLAQYPLHLDNRSYSSHLKQLPLFGNPNHQIILYHQKNEDARKTAGYESTSYHY